MSGEVLPGGRFVLVAVTAGTAGEWDKGRIVVHSLESGDERPFIDGGSDARYVRTGHSCTQSRASYLPPRSTLRARSKGRASRC